MSDTTEPQAPDAPVVAQQPQDGEPKTFDADYVAKLRQEAAKYRTEAKANDEARKELDQIKEAQKSDAEKANDKLTNETRRANEATALALRYKIALVKGIAIEDADLFMTATDEDTLNKQADRLAQRTPERKPGHIPTQGTGDPKPPGSTYSSGRERALAKQNNS